MTLLQRLGMGFDRTKEHVQLFHRPGRLQPGINPGIAVTAHLIGTSNEEDNS